MNGMLQSRPIAPAEIPFFNLQYLYGCKRPADPTIVWGTDVDVEQLNAFVRQRNAAGTTLVSVAHVLVQAVGKALALHPQLNCRVVGERIHRFRGISVRMLTYDRKREDVHIVTFNDADRISLEEIGRHLWTSQCENAAGESSDSFDRYVLRLAPSFLRRWFIKCFWRLDRSFRLPRIGRIDRHLDSPVLVNYLGFAGTPPMRAYKPSRFPDETSLLSVTMGCTEERPVVRDGQIVARPIAPFFVRADHRIADAQVLARFVNSLRGFLVNPGLMEGENDPW